MVENLPFTECYLFITEECNLRCKYCYENFTKNSSSYMSLKTAKKSIDFLIKNMIEHDKKEFLITFFGGEPLLNLDVMRNVINYTFNEAEQYNINLSFSVITNGTIYNKQVEQFILEWHKRTENVNLQVSIDGIPQVQDKNRITKMGEPTSKIVEENLSKFIALFNDNHIDTTIRTHSALTKNNISNLFSSYKYLKELGITGPGFSFVNEEEWDENDISIYKQQLSLISDYIYRECISLCSLKPYYCGGETIIQRNFSINRNTCSAGREFCSIVPNGDIYPCPRIYSKTRELKLGNVFEGIVDNKIRKIFFDVSRKDMHAENNSCGNCENAKCIICMAYNSEKYGDMRKCDPHICLMYKAKWDFIKETKKRFDKLYDKLNYSKCGEIAFLKNRN